MRRYCLVLLLACACADAVHDPAPACMEALASDQTLRAIAGKAALADPRAATPAMLADTSVANAAEGAAVRDWVQARRACLAQGAEFRRLHLPPVLTAIESETEAQLAAAAAELARQKLSFAEFAGRAREIEAQATARHVAAVRELRQQRQMSGEGQRQTEWLARMHAGRETRQREQAAAAASQARETAARQAPQERLLASQQAVRDAHFRDAAARSAADTQRLLNSRASPLEPSIRPAIPIPPNVSCVATGVDWHCVSR